MAHTSPHKPSRQHGSQEPSDIRTRQDRAVNYGRKDHYINNNRRVKEALLREKEKNNSAYTSPVHNTQNATAETKKTKPTPEKSTQSKSFRNHR